MGGGYICIIDRRRQDDGASAAQLRKRWEAPGLSVVAPDTMTMTVVLFMRKETRARWRRNPAASTRAFRNQQHAPPDPLPDNTIQIVTAGAADARKKNQPPPPAGYGYAAYEKGIRWQLTFEGAGQITAGAMPNVKTTTSNLAELVAVARACQWAQRFALAVGRPICIRYSSEYAARIATGAWKAKKHKAMAEEARRAWESLKRSSGGSVWMRHKQGGGRATELAEQGKRGAQKYVGLYESFDLP